MKADLKQLESEYKKALKDANTLQKNGAQLGTTVKRWLEMGKNGQKTVITFATELKEKENQLALDVVNMACKRHFKKNDIDLSIKGLGFKTENGKKQAVEISPKVKPTNTGNTNDKGDKNTIKAIFDAESFDDMFVKWSSDQQKAYIEHLTNLMDAKTKQRTK